MKDDIFSKKTKIKELEKILANKDKTIPVFSDYDDYSDKKCTNQILPQGSAQRTYNGQHASKSLQTPQQPQQSEKPPSFDSQLKNYVKAERQKYAECIVKCKAEAMNFPDGSKEGKQHGKKHKTIKEYVKENNKENSLSKGKSGLQNKNARNKQSRQRHHRQISQNHQSNSRQKYAECIVKCKAEAMNFPDGSKEGKQHGKKHKTIKEYVKENNKENSLSKGKSGLQNKNARNKQSRQRYHRQISQNHQSNSNNTKDNLSKDANKVQGSIEYLSQAQSRYVADMFDYLKPLLKKRPDKIMLVIGAKDIEHTSSQEILAKIKTLIDFIHGCLPDCHVVISEVLKRVDKKNLNNKIDDVNRSLKSMNCDSLPQQNITFDLLGKRGFHLNFFGNKQLAKNIIDKLRSLSH